MNQITLASACHAWQGGRDIGSSPIRGGARVLTATKHYFSAPFIETFERSAREDPTTMECAQVLLDALDESDHHDATGWGMVAGKSTSWVGRGIQTGPQDDQIEESLDTGLLRMPLWGVSLSRPTAESYGRRFIFELDGPFPAIPAWLESGIKEEEQELIVGGAYEVLNISRTKPDETRVSLRFDHLIPTQNPQTPSE